MKRRELQCCKKREMFEQFEVASCMLGACLDKLLYCVETRTAVVSLRGLVALFFNAAA